MQKKIIFIANMRFETILFYLLNNWPIHFDNDLLTAVGFLVYQKAFKMVDNSILRNATNKQLSQTSIAKSLLNLFFRCL